MNPENNINNENNLNNYLININSQPNTINSDSDSEANSSSTNLSSFFSLKNIRKRIHSSQINFDKTKNIKYKDLINEDEAYKKEKIFVAVESVNIFKIYAHLSMPIDWFYIVLAILGSIGAGISVPLISYSTSEVYSNIANTSENRDSVENIEEMIISVKKTMDAQITKQIFNGIASFISYFSSIFFWSLVGNRCIFNLKKKYFTTIISQEQAWFDENNPFIISSSMYSELEKIESGLSDKVGVVIALISQCCIGFIFAFISSWKLTLVMSCFLPFAIIVPNFLLISMRNGIIQSRRALGRAGGIIEELLYNIKTVASFANFDYELKKYNEKIEEIWKMDLNNSCKFGFAIGSIYFIFNMCIFIGFIYGRKIIKNDYNTNMGRVFTGGDVISAIFCVLFGAAGVVSLAPNIKILQDASFSFASYYNLYHRKPRMDFSKSIEKPPISEIEGKIEFNEVSFYYPSDPNKKMILDKINLLFEPGKKIALVGESGCGKTTIANLIERLYDINEGQLLIDDMEINRYDIKHLRSFIGYVEQEPYLFNKSIKDNIIFGREEYLKTLGDVDELIKNVCEEIYVNEFVDSLPDGLNYNVGIKGSKLSGGQKQRIAIARAILTKPKILILDEATSSLDNKSEKEVQKSLDKISQKNITTIIIAHRLSTIINSDLIYVLKNGKVLEKGNHQELLDLGGYYAELIKSQLEIINMKKLNEECDKNKNVRHVENEQISKDNLDIALDEKNISIKPFIIVKELKDYKLNLILAISSACIIGCLSPISGFVMAKGINSLNSKYENKRSNNGLKYSLIFLSFAFLQGMGNCLMLWKFQSLGMTLAKIYRRKIVSKYLQFHLSYFDLKINSPGSLVTRLSFDTMNLNQLILTIFGATIECSCIAILGLIIGCIYDYRLTLIDFCFVPFIVLANVLRKSMVNGRNKIDRKANIKAGGILSECIINTKTIFSFNFQKAAIEKYLQTIEYIKQYFLRDALISGFFIGLGNFCSYAAYATIFRVAKKYILEGNLDSESMALVLSLITNCTNGISNGLANLGDLKKAKLAFKSIYSILGTKSLISPFYKDNFRKITAKNIKGKIEFKHVFFSYPTRPENFIIKDLSFTIMPGQHVAFVGHSGSGKSTIIQLLSRFYDIEEGKGEILIDDINIKKYNLFELRKKIGLVLQEPSLFRMTVLENVRYGKLDATDEECIEAAKKANIMKLFTKDRINEIIQISTPHSSYMGPHSPHGPHGPHSTHSPHYPHGTHGLHGNHGSQAPNDFHDSQNSNILQGGQDLYASKIGSNPNDQDFNITHNSKENNNRKDSNEAKTIEEKSIGNKQDPVSAGEKQRLAIARAFLKDPIILLMDEATSSLDKFSELEVQKSLEKLAKNRTCVSVAHRLSTIENCDQIFVLENGSLIEQGTHNELMKLGKKYYIFHKYTNFV